jgi:hypothetical protein
MLFLKDLFAAIAAIFGLVNKRSDLNNTDEMKKREILKEENNQNDDDARNIKDGDLDAIRRKLS